MTQSSAPTAGVKPLNILIVDDSATMRALLHRVVGLADLPIGTIYQAPNGLEALKVLERNVVDIVVSDVVMPDLDGYDLYMEIKARGDTPVLLMTAYYYDRDHVIKRSRLEGLHGVLFKKPVNPERLKALIRELTRRPLVAASA